MKLLHKISKNDWRTYLLILSVSLNFLVVGVVVGTLISGPHGGADEEMDSKRQQGTPFITALTKEQRFMLGEQLRSLGFGHDEEHVKMGKSARHVMEVLTAESFDLEKFTQAVKAHDSLTENRRVIVQQLFIKKVSEFDESEREIFAEKLGIMLHEFVSEFIEH